MGARVESYRAALRDLSARGDDPRAYLAEHSGLPGPRGNLELIWAAAEELDIETLEDLAGSVDEFEACVGVVGVGRAIADGRVDLVGVLRGHAGDARWRVREAVAMALQRWGDADLPAMVAEAERWAAGGRLEQRAAAAGTCEPRLLADPSIARRVVALLDAITATLPAAADRRTDAFRVLRQALGYCWSVAIAADPVDGLVAFARWRHHPDPDVAWVVRENLRKARLRRVLEGHRLPG
ncbi:MAG: HEAT repeat domain-containing protein [Chloroflexi bacterium]|nr:HEAT repeat domain-containing protein [Chloroflexota bacterium]